MLLLALIVLPALLGIGALAARSARVDAVMLLAGAFAHLVATILFWTAAPDVEMGLFLKLDALGLLFLTITSVLFCAAALYAVPMLLHGTHDKPSAPHRFVPCLLWFLSAMSLVTATQHLVVLWAAVEGTTLASAPLIYYYKRREALEAAWKYLLICSVGIALALLGTFFLGIAASASSATESGLSLSTLTHVAPLMSRPWLKAAFVLALVGYGTKMGLAPLHTWLPDTHSQAPSPVSALLSGALLNCAFLAILRFYQVCLASGDGAFAGAMLTILGFASIATACVFMAGQGDYKRLFAYSSIENMGIMAVGIGMGGIAAFASLFHAVNHSLCKAGLFFLAGNILRVFGTTDAGKVRGVVRRIPWTGVLTMTLFLAIGGLPPFGPFWSEFMIFQSAIDGPNVWIGVIFLILVALAFLGMAGVLLPMLQGGSDGTATPVREGRISVLMPLAMACATLTLGIALPPFLADALHRAAALIARLPAGAGLGG